jgi:hypothetical protein
MHRYIINERAIQKIMVLTNTSVQCTLEIFNCNDCTYDWSTLLNLYLCTSNHRGRENCMASELCM